MHRFRVVVLLALTLALTATLGAWPQLGLPRLPKRLPREVPRLDRLPSLDDLLNRQPLTSTLDDAVTEVPLHAPVALPAGPATVGRGGPKADLIETILRRSVRHGGLSQ